MCIEFIATTVGGGYINGTAESIATSGLVWTLAPFGIFIGLNLGKFYCGILICMKGNVKAAVKWSFYGENI